MRNLQKSKTTKNGSPPKKKHSIAKPRHLSGQTSKIFSGKTGRSVYAEAKQPALFVRFSQVLKKLFARLKPHTVENTSKLWSLLFFPISIFFMELILKASIGLSFFDIGLLYTALFSLAFGALLGLMCSFFAEKINRAIAVCLMLISTLLFCLQTVYYQIFRFFFVLFSFKATTDALDLGFTIMLTNIWNQRWFLLLLFVPSVLLIAYRRRMFRFAKLNWPLRAVMAGVMIAAQLTATILVTSSKNSMWYSNEFNPEKSVSLFGLITTTRLDIKQLIFGIGENINLDGYSKLNTNPGNNEPHIINSIDFNRLAAEESDESISELHRYFANQSPSYTNKYTGLFEGKNLIWIVAESFSPYVLSIAPELTPNLNRLYNEGFQFKNFYTPSYGISTSDGEYVTLQGLLPKSGVWSMSQSSSNYLPQTMAHMLSSEGYNTLLAYHNHTYSYYDRNKSLPNMGYSYKGVGGGLILPKITSPNSDYDMMQVTTADYINNSPFHVYYITMSGHASYSFSDNDMARRNRDFVKNLPYSETVKAYLACNIELDKAIGYLFDQLEEAGIAKNTVIALSADHYPYGLESSDALNELKGRQVDMTFERYENSFLLWSGSMKEPIVVDKVGSSLDILPTLSNLMGVEYDSRLMMGIDMLSDDAPLVIFKDFSWITAHGQYNARTEQFTPSLDTSNLSEDYIAQINQIVAQKFAISRLILETDYFKEVFYKTR